jgi:hypothetical protein
MGGPVAREVVSVAYLWRQVLWYSGKATRTDLLAPIKQLCVSPNAHIVQVFHSHVPVSLSLVASAGLIGVSIGLNALSVHATCTVV